MEIIRDLEALARNPYPVTAIGNFDGVHLGHRAILKAAIDRARPAGGTAFALTFDPLPAKLLVPARAPQLILTPADKLELLRQSGIDGVIVLNFTLELSLLSPRDFVRDYLRGKIGGRELGFDTDVVAPVKIDGIEISSTKVREAITTGDMHRASRLLGRYHFLSGPVVRGRERGRTIGFPTANLASETECIPPDGVYATRVILDDGAYPSITNVGMRPTFAESARSIEAHIFDFTRDIYGQRIKLELVERIRAERKFDTPDALKAQIALDLSKAREILAAA